MMKKKLLHATTLGALGIVIALGGVTMTQAKGQNSMSVGSAGITAALENYYENSADPNAVIIKITEPQLLVAAPTEKETSEVEPETEKETKAKKNQASNAKKKKKTTEKETDYYDTIAVSQVDDFVNVRRKPSTDSEIVGKIYNNCAATIIKEYSDWYKIESGNVKGYIKKEFFITGDEARDKALEIAHVTATITADELNVRDGQGTDSAILTTVTYGAEFDVIEHGDGWVYLSVDTDIQGWVSMDYVVINIKFDTAITLEEEAEKIAEEERLAKEAEEAAEEARRAKEEAERLEAQQAAQETEQQTEQVEQQTEQVEKQTEQLEQDNVSEAKKKSLAAQRNAVVAFALQYVGNPYVYGGNSLTQGTDCSGFTSLVYANFGYGLNRVSSDQQYNGIGVSLNELQPGDLLLYSNEGYGIGHVAIYIGNGQIVHAATPEQGIVIGNAYYRTPVCARRIIY